jgi:osmotically-inducible protein OsmY
MKTKQPTKASKLGPLKTLAGTLAVAALSFSAQAESPSDSIKEKLSDGWKEGKAETIFLFNPNLNAFEIDADVEGEKMILRGVVESPIDRELAAAIAGSIEGISEVDNLIIINPEKSTLNKEMAKLKQTAIDAKTLALVKARLLENEYVSGFGINVDVKEGDITLSGTVNSAEAKDLAKWLALGTKGVTSVDNDIEVNNQS